MLFFYFGRRSTCRDLDGASKVSICSVHRLYVSAWYQKYPGELSGLDEWLMASLGASTLLVFAFPQSQMAQPWTVITDNTLSALAGFALIHLLNQPLLAIPLASSLSILGMFVLRCLHPPAVVVALIVVLGHVMHYLYAFPSAPYCWYWLVRFIVI